MNILADRYQFRARSIPQFLMALPLCLILVTHTSDKVVLGFLSLALFFVFFQGHFSSRAGRKIEKKLQKKNKLKTFSDYVLDEYAKDKEAASMAIVVKVAKKAKLDNPLGVSKACIQEERISKVNNWLKENTREIEKFPALFDKNCDYGFYRNMLAMKIWAFGSFLVAIVCFIFPCITIIPTEPYITLKSIFFTPKYTLEIYSFWILFVFLWIIFWCRVASLKSLQKANEEYIKALLNTADSI